MRTSATRRSLRISALEGVVAELVSACASGGVLTAWALYLALPPVCIGVLGALPFASQLVQLPAAWVSSRRGPRRVALIAVAASRQAVLPLAALPFLPLPLAAKQAVLLLCAALFSVLGVVGNNAWTAWMDDLVPRQLRGRYFGKRSALCALGNALAPLCAGLALDRGGPFALSLLALAASAAGAATTLLLRRQHDPRAKECRPAPRAAHALAPLRSLAGRRALAFQLVWAGSSGIAAAFYPIHMIGNLRMGFARMAVYTGGIAAVRMVAAPLWGRALDRLGARPVLIVCTFGLCLSPLLWMFPRADLLWPLALDAALCGALLSGQGLASFSLPLSLAPRSERSFYLAAFASAGGLATGVSSALGGALVHVLPGQSIVLGHPLLAAQVLFLVGAAGRLVAGLLALRLVEPGAQPASALLSFKPRAPRATPPARKAA